MDSSHSLPVLDTRSRPLRDLRISVTDRCNFRCSYCMPKEEFGPGFRFLPRSEVLTFEEIHRTARIAVGMGVKKLRVTGGEPLLRSGLPTLIAQLSELDADLALTTNGSRLQNMATALQDAGLRRITVSVDSLDDATFRKMNAVNYPLAEVLSGIDAAAAAGLRVKVNCVVRKGLNDQGLVEMAGYFRERGHTLRFIEFMDVGLTNGWSMDHVVRSRDVVERISRAFPCEAVNATYQGEVAKRWRYSDGKGEFGVISSVTQPFCGECSRLRLSADGKVYGCLFASEGWDLKSGLRGGLSDNELEQLLREFWSRRQDRYSEMRSAKAPGQRRVEMSYIGG